MESDRESPSIGSNLTRRDLLALTALGLVAGADRRRVSFVPTVAEAVKAAEFV